ncbi:EamA-like transporter family protein [Leishmania donovani]|uniref:EamA-like transporter family protein n=1 Tax=Leishmania donovani TaxID=5661 RepID=A0A504XBU5_LEIDO|nr:EamA-like transporter family protein [Leishmania donovani]
MPSCLSPFTRESAAGAAGTEDIDDAPGSTIIAAQRSRLRELVDRAYSEALRTVAHLRLLMPLSKYGLGVALILCVTVIWVASSVWIQYIFGSLEFNKPFFLTYFNTTGFCLWNAGFFFSARWRRTPWDETSRTQPVCIEDARLDSREPSSTEEAEAEAGEDASIGAVREAPHHSRSVSGVSPTLSHTVPHCRSLAEWELQRPLNHCSPSSNLISHAVPHSTQPPHYGHALLSRSAITAVSARHAGTPPPTPRLPPHQCRDYSLPTSSASSAREEVVSVILADEDELADATLWQVATRREVVISSKMLRHNGTEAPPRRRYRQRARRQRIRRYSLRRIWRCALVFCPLWFLANYLFNLSLSITSVASNTILSSTSSIWALFLSHMVLRQPVGAHRLVAVVLSVSGTVVVGLSDKDAAGGHSTVGGNIVALLSAFFYAAYTSVLKFHLPDDERFAMGMVFGAVGVLNCVFLWPGLVLLSVTGAEKFAWPSWQQLWPLLMNSLVGTNLSDVLWARSVVLTSPVVATLGLSLTTPLAMVVDAISKNAHFSGAYVAGAVLVMVGFLLANLPI